MGQYDQMASARGGTIGAAPNPERLQDVLQGTCKHLAECLGHLDGIGSALDGPTPIADGKTEQPAGLAGWAFEVRRLASIVNERLANHLQRL